MKKIKLAIGIPNTGVIKSQTVFCLCRTLKDFPYDYTVLFKEGSVLHWNREELVRGAVDAKCTHLLFLDSDMFFEKDAVLRLLKRKKDVIGADYKTRKINGENTARLLPGRGDLREAETVATGFLLIDLKVFQKIGQPWFFWGENEGEDHWFCRKVREAGIKVYCDLSIKIGHIGDFIY